MPVFSSSTYTFIYYLAYQKQINIINRVINRSKRSLDLDRYKIPENKKIDKKKPDNKNPYSPKLMVWNDSIYLNSSDFYLNNDDYDSDSDSDDEYEFDIILNDYE